MGLDINLLLSSTDEANQKKFDTALADVDNYIATLQTVKIFIADSRSFGHQASSITILFNLIRLGCKATFIIVYETAAALAKVRVLLPITPNQTDPIQLARPDGGMVTVEFLSFDEAQEPCDLALTGGYDDTIQNLIKLDATSTIELQPFNWNKGENSIYKKGEGENPAVKYSLDTAIANFNQHSFYIDNPIQDNDFWDQFTAIYPQWATNVNLTKKVLELYGDTEDFYLCPVYGINTGSIDPILSLFNLCTGISYMQDQTQFIQAKKAVIISFSPQNQKGQDNDVNLQTLKNLIVNRNYKGGFYTPTANCIQYLASSSLGTRVKYYDVSDDGNSDPANLQTAIDNLNSNEILVVQIGPVPAPVFNYTYFVANLPFVFEGQNTAALALNFGIPYIHITTPGNYIGNNLYPVIPPGSAVGNSNGKVATMIASKTSVFPGLWKSPTAKLTKSTININNKAASLDALSPSYVLGKFMTEAVLNSPDNKMIRYFANFKGYFHDVKNDKLILALIALQYNVNA